MFITQMYVIFNSIYKTMYTLHQKYLVYCRHNTKLQNNLNTTSSILKESEQLD